MATTFPSVNILPMSGGGGVVQLPRDDSGLINLRLLQEALGSVGDVGQIIQQQAQGQALADALMGKPGTPATTPGGAVQLPGNALTPQGGNEFQPGTPATQPLLPPNLLPIAQQLARSGRFDEATKMVVDYQASIRPEPITPYQQAQLDIAQQGQDMRSQGMDLDRQGLALRREQFASDREYQRAKLALDERLSTATDPAKLSDASSFRSQYTGLSQDFIKIRDAYGKVRSAVENPSPAGDLSLIFGYMKILDPGSTVREGEQATAQNTTGAAGRIAGLYNRVMSGERLTPEQRADFAAQAHNLFQSQRERQDELQRSFSGTAQRLFPNFNPADAVPDYIGTSRDWEPIGIQPAGPGRLSEADVTGMAGGAPAQLLGKIATMTAEQINALDLSVMTEEQLRALDARERQLGLN